MVLLIQLLTLAASVSGLAINRAEIFPSIAKKDDTKVVKMNFDVERTYSTNSTKRRAFDEGLTNDRDVRYLMDLNIGSNKQKIRVEIDTGSSDLWVHDENYGKAYGGTFYQSQSSSFKSLDVAFDIYYNDGSTAKGQYGTDTITLDDGMWVTNVQFALVSQCSNSNLPGVFGISRKRQEATKQHYDNYPYALVDAGLVNKPSYSIYMAGDKGEKGLILFGGIDTAKFEGDLAYYPIVDNFYASIELESLNFNNRTYNISRHAQMDTGTSWLYMPKNIVLDIAETLGADTCDDCYDRLVPCDQPTDKFLTFDFGQQKIQLSYADLVVRPFTDGCLLGVTVAKDGTNGNNLIMGDVFMRKTYTYFDLEKDVVGLAPAIDTLESNVIQA